MVFGYHRIYYCTQSLSPGLVRTEIMDAGHLRTLTSHDIFSVNPCLDPQDIADAVVYVVGTPPHVQVITNSSFYGQNIALFKLIIKTDKDLRWLSYCCCRRFQSPGMCYCIDRQAVADIPKDHNDYLRCQAVQCTTALWNIGNYSLSDTRLHPSTLESSKQTFIRCKTKCDVILISNEVITITIYLHDSNIIPYL